MKKTLIILMVLLISVSGLFAYDGSMSLGISYLTAKDSALGVSASEQVTSMSLNADDYFFGKTSKVGFNIGASILFPISSKPNGVDVPVDFFDCNYCPKLGIAFKYDTNGKLKSFTSLGYELLFHIKSAYTEYGMVKGVTLIHGVYVAENLSYLFSEKVGLSFGLDLFVPFTANMIASSQGISESLNISYFGIAINPHVGVGISL